ncbi:MAG: glycerophosphodiester phosphodiesterase [Clostridia bacterium]|nr:glycerophosphodiester phosphodiesterase [Clostridia bacterium]
MYILLSVHVDDTFIMHWFSATVDPSSDSFADRNSAEIYDIQFHRGGRDARPENTLYAFQYSIENGTTTIECDMQMTKDGHLVMSHNPALNPDITRDSEGNPIGEEKVFINSLTLDEVRSYNVGRMNESSEYYRLHGMTQIQADAHIPTLRELFELVASSGNDRIRMNIEVKAYPDPAQGSLHENATDPDLMVKEFYELTKEFGFEDRVTLQSFDWAALKTMEQLDASIETCALYNETDDWEGPDAKTLWLGRDEPSPWLGGLNIHHFEGNPVKAAHSLGIDAISPYYPLVTEDLVQSAHALGMKVVAWTVNDVQDMEKLYAMGVDGMISDKTWTLREFFESKGEALLPKQAVDAPYHLDKDHHDVEIGPFEEGKDASH